MKSTSDDDNPGTTQPRAARAQAEYDYFINLLQIGDRGHFSLYPGTFSTSFGIALV